MKTTTPLILVLAAALPACASASPGPRGFADPSAGRTMTRLIETPAGRPANDISEEERRAWFDAQRPQAEPVDADRFVRRDCGPPECGEHCDRHCVPSWLWAIPLSLSFGYSSGGHHDHGGWGVGTTWGGWHY
jgi:hypothetical protein